VVSDRARGLLVKTLTMIAALALVVAVGAAYVREVTGSSTQFADRATDALRHDSVRSLVAEKVTDDLVRSDGDLLAARPLIESVVTSVVGQRAFFQLFRAGVRDVHRAVIKRDRDMVTLTVAGAGTLAASALDTVSPRLAAKLRPADRAELLNDEIGSVSGSAVRFIHDVQVLAIIAAIIALLSAAGAIGLAADRRAAITGLGVSVAIAGVLLIIVWTLGRAVAENQVSGASARAAVGAVYGSFLGDLRTIAWIVAGAGAVLAAAAGSLVRPVAIDEPLGRAWGWLVTDPKRAWERGLRGVALAAVGVFCVADHAAVLTVLFTAAGAYLIYSGVVVLLALINRPQAAQDPRKAAAGIVRPALISIAVVAIAVGGVLAVFFASGGVSTTQPAQAPCDGSVQLCDRPLTDVALAATHNSMSVPLPGWYSPEQEAPIPQQLRDGIRGLLFDTHYATKLKNGRLRTDFNEEFAKALKEGVVPRAEIEAVARLRKQVGFKGSGKRGVYLCHMFCELGGTPVVTVLKQIRDFLVANPSQVIVAINEDYVTPKDFVAAVRKAGLAKFVYTPPAPGARWPTLQQMIDANRRIVFLAENHGGAAPWYQSAYRSVTQETPYNFKHVKQLTAPSELAASCRPNRGPAEGAPLFLVNGWVQTDPVPLESNAAKVNAYAPLEQRLRTCERIRHHIPNLVAVDFYRKGDVFKAVRAINGLP
jgi:hypothetical protein